MIDSNHDEKATEKAQEDVLNLTANENENENAIDDEIIEVSLPGQ